MEQLSGARPWAENEAVSLTAIGQRIFRLQVFD